ncbi:hypothetical protein HanIR_Chr05g0220441 [Helianthus annuus]|nr:hypothetical protein HanIR_Chr05g0220441 [Helianthus annuus]
MHRLKLNLFVYLNEHPNFQISNIENKKKIFLNPYLNHIIYYPKWSCGTLCCRVTHHFIVIGGFGWDSIVF